MPKKVYFLVGLELPEGVSPGDALSYIKAAVRSHKGGFHPNDPLFELNNATVTVHRANTPLGITSCPSE